MKMPSQKLCSSTRRSARLAAAGKAAEQSTENEFHSNQKSAPESSFHSVQNDKIALKQSSTILSLNDDCLLKTFSQLDLQDLCAVKDSCQRFSCLAVFDAQRRFRKIDCVLVELSMGSLMLPSALVLAKFGRIIKYLAIQEKTDDEYAYYFKDQAVSLLKTCTSLEYLAMFDMDMMVFPITKLKSLFTKIGWLVLVDCDNIPTKLDGLLNASKMLEHFIVEVTKYPFLKLSSLCPAIVQHGMEYKTIGLQGKIRYDIKVTQFLESIQLSKVRCLEIKAKELTPWDMILLGRLDFLKKLTLNEFVPTAGLFDAINEFLNLNVLVLRTKKKIPDEMMASATSFIITVAKISKIYKTSLIRRNQNPIENE